MKQLFIILLIAAIGCKGKKEPPHRAAFANDTTVNDNGQFGLPVGPIPDSTTIH